MLKDTSPASLGIAAAACFAAEAADMQTFTLTSSAFTAQSSIPARYTCEGGDTSPALAWTHSPAGTKSFASIVDDPTRRILRRPRPPGCIGWCIYL